MKPKKFAEELKRKARDPFPSGVSAPLRYRWSSTIRPDRFRSYNVLLTIDRDEGLWRLCLRPLPSHATRQATARRVG